MTRVGDGLDLSSPGKRVVFTGARGNGAEARDFYDHPDRHGLVGENYFDMLNRCAARWGWSCGEELEVAVDAGFEEEHVPWGKKAEALRKTLGDDAKILQDIEKGRLR